MTLTAVIGAVLIGIGLWAMLSRSHLVKIIIGFSIMDTGVHLVVVSLGYIRNRTAPILDETLGPTDALNRIVDPVPSALVLTAIVIGLAVTALMLVFAVRLYKKTGSLNIHDFTELKW